MSINALTNAAIARRPDFEPLDEVPQGLAAVAHAASLMPPAVQPAGVPAPAPSNVNAALQTLTTYIPTEVLTLYVAAVAALGSSKAPNGVELGHWLPFWIFLVGTPLAAWLAFATKLKSAGRPIPARPGVWPLWEMSAATIAYAAWAFALPKTPFLEYRWYSAAIAGLAVLLVSWGLGAIAPLMQKSLPAK